MITQENIPYTAGEIKAMVKTCEKYNAALDKASKLRVQNPFDTVGQMVEHIFPELKDDNNEEKIRKEIVEFIISSNKYGTNERCEAWLNWLEKQGWLEKQCEQPTEKVEPKFKVGDWVILNGVVAKILDKQKYGFVGLDIDGKDFFCNYGHTDSMRLWTIQDAKDGDVLVDEDNNIGLYLGEKDDLYWHSCIYLGCDNCLRAFNIEGYHKHKNTKPATKEQRELLFSKMKQEGYEWNAEKKEVKKIEQKTLNADEVIAWLEDQACLGWIEDVEVHIFVDKFKQDFKL